MPRKVVTLTQECLPSDTQWTDPVISATLLHALAQQPNHLLLAVEDQDLSIKKDSPDRYLGYLLARVIPQENADIMTLFVKPAFQRQKLAVLMLENLFLQAKHAGCPAIVMEVRASNQAALNLYQSLGFTRLTTRPAYYSNPSEAALVLHKIL